MFKFIEVVIRCSLMIMIGIFIYHLDAVVAVYPPAVKGVFGL